MFPKKSNTSILPKFDESFKKIQALNERLKDPNSFLNKTTSDLIGDMKSIYTLLQTQGR